MMTSRNPFKAHRLPILFFIFLMIGVLETRAQVIRIETQNSALVFSVAENKRLYQSYFGDKVSSSVNFQASKQEAYITAGLDNAFEPAIRMVHADGNPSLELRFVEFKEETQGDNVKHIAILLKDPKYPVEVTLNFQSYFKEDIIKSWVQIRHQESRTVTLTNFASSMLHFNASNYWLTQLYGTHHAREANIEEVKLPRGIKIIDSKFGTRTHQYSFPGFYLSLNELSDETQGEVIAGTLAWTGNFQCLFEIDNTNTLRVVSGMNPYASDYKLEKNKTFTTPEFIFTYSNQGKGKATRSLHNWARNYGVLDGDKSRLTLLNNWETTYFNLDEPKIEGLLADTKTLGVDLFLLDDAWFGNKYPRVNDKAGLGDWQINKTRFPNGIANLIKSADSKGVKFGIWVEPEMVNPKSELYERHPDWILKLPNRDEHYERNQLVLDVANPKVQEFMYETIDNLLTENPGIAYIKWDCNRTMTNAYSQYLKDKQSHLAIEYNLGLYKVLDRLRKKYPHLPMMLCSGGGGRTDYGAMKYFQEFWPSDNTNPLERIYIQWGYSHFFPALTSANHVTSMGKQPIKFRTDVAMMGKLGFDINISKLTADELKFCQDAVKEYNRIKDVIWRGDMYRLASPYNENRAVLMYAAPDKAKAILFAYNLDLRYREIFNKVNLQGLDPQKNYKVQEINLMPGVKSKFADHDKVYTGEYLMKVGLAVSSFAVQSSAIFEISGQ